MLKPPTSASELERLAVLRAHHLVDAEKDPTFDGIAALAARVAQTPMALVSLVDEQRQWFHARVGVDATETPRDISFCGHAVASGAPLIVTDASEDARFRDNPLVAREDGVRFYAGLPLHSADGHALGTLCVIDRRSRDLTDEQMMALENLARQAEVALAQRRASVEALRTPASGGSQFGDATDLVENAPDIITLLSPAGVILFESPAVRALGYEPDELVGRLAFDYVHEEDHAHVLEAFARCAREAGRHELVEFRFRQSGGGWRVLESVAKSVAHESLVTGIVVHSRDVTERRSRNQALHEQVACLQDAVDARGAANKQLAGAQLRRERLAALIVHDLKSPLSSMMLNAQAVLERRDIDPEVRATVQDMFEAAGRLARMVRDVLDVTVALDGRLLPRVGHLDLENLLLQVARQFRSRLADNNQRLSFAMDLGHPMVSADRDMLYRVLENLIDNAHRHTPHGGVICVSAATLADGVCEIRVTDSGPGVPMEDRQRLFQEQAWGESNPPRGAGAGHGLGLVLCRLVVEAHGGSIGVGEGPTGGASFWFRLPLAPTELMR